MSNYSCQMQGVLQLNESINGTERNVIMGDWFSSCEPSKEFTKKKLTMLDTMRENKAELFPNL